MPDIRSLCDTILTLCSFRETTKNLEMASFKENLDVVIRQACLVLSVNDCKDLRRICLRHLLSNLDVLGQTGGDGYE